MATYWVLHALPCLERPTSRTKTVRVSNYGLGRAPREGELERAGTPTARLETLVTAIVVGTASDAPTPPWTIHVPSVIHALRKRLAAAWHEARPLYDEEDAGWQTTQVEPILEILHHAGARAEHVVSVHETDDHCFRRGQLPAPGDPWTRGCVEVRREGFGTSLPAGGGPLLGGTALSLPLPLLAAGAVLLGGLSLATWRHHRLRAGPRS